MSMDNKNLDESNESLASDSYQNSLEQLKGILERIEHQEENIDDLLEQVKQANLLVKDCKSKLCTIENNVNQIL